MFLFSHSTNPVNNPITTFMFGGFIFICLFCLAGNNFKIIFAHSALIIVTILEIFILNKLKCK